MLESDFKGAASPLRYAFRAARKPGLSFPAQPLDGAKQASLKDTASPL